MKKIKKFLKEIKNSTILEMVDKKIFKNKEIINDFLEKNYDIIDIFLKKSNLEIIFI